MSLGRVAAVVLCLLCAGALVTALCPAASARAAQSGTCSTGLTWTLDDAGHLTISGTGSMPVFTSRSTDDWRAYKGDIQSATICEGVTDIGNYAFYGCVSLTTVSIPSTVKKIGMDAFMMCEALEPFDIPGTVEEIGSFAFYDCVLFEDLTLQEGLKVIGANAFQNCMGIRSIYIPSTVEMIGNNAFETQDTNLTSITVSPASVHFMMVGPVLCDKAQTEALYCLKNASGVTLPDTLKKIQNAAFRECDLLTHVTVPEGVTWIGTQAFAYCDGLLRVDLPVSLVSLKDNVFHEDNALTDVYYGGTQEMWQALVGTGTHSLSSKTIHFGSDDGSGLTTLDSGTTATGLNWTLDKDRRLTVTGQGPMPHYSSGDILDWLYYRDVIESAVISEGVTRLGDRSLYNFPKLTRVTLPSTIEDIGVYALAYDALLAEITIPAAVTHIGDDAFKNCSGLTTIYCYQDTYGAQWAESYVAGLDHECQVVYLDGQEEITRKLFLPAGLQTIGDEAFMNLTVQMVDVPGGCEAIGARAFSGCAQLQVIYIPLSVASIGEDAFSGCDQVTIACEEGSAADQYALAHQIPTVPYPGE